MTKRLVLRSATALVAALSVVAMASAQDRGGNNAALTVSQEFRAVDNARLTAGGGKSALESVTSLGLTYRASTKATSFSAATGVGLTYGTDTQKLDVSDPNLSLALKRSTRSSEIGASLSFRQSQVGRSNLGEDFDDTDLTPSTGTLQRVQLGLTGAMGKTARVGLSYGLSYGSRDYSDVGASGPYDSRSASARAALRMDVTRTVSTNLAYRVNRSRTENPTGNDVDGQSLTASVTAAISPTLSASAGLVYSSTKRTPQAGGASRTTEGLGYNLGLTHTMSNGTLSGRISGSQTSNGMRTSLSLNRSLKTKTGDLALSFGAVQTGDLGWDPLVSLQYKRDLKRGALSVQLSQQAVTNSEDKETLRTRLSASYSQSLTRTASLSAGIAVADIRGLSSGTQNSRRSTLDINYRQALAQDWNLVGGYSLLHSSRSGRADVTANTVFVRVEKQFDWRP